MSIFEAAAEDVAAFVEADKPHGLVSVAFHRVALTRAQMFDVMGHRPQSNQRILLAAGPDGRLAGIRHETSVATSPAYLRRLPIPGRSGAWRTPRLARSISALRTAFTAVSTIRFRLGP